MKCPVCGTDSLTLDNLDKTLRGYKCDQCAGYWISGNQYWQWLDSRGGPLLKKELAYTEDLSVNDSTHAKICVECGRLMIRNRVGQGVSFFLDRCTACGGTWFDKNEWEVLKRRHLHDEVHTIFSAVWQSENRQQQQRTTHEKKLLAALGQPNYDKLKDMKSWFAKHPKKNWILAYLLND